MCIVEREMMNTKKIQITFTERKKLKKNQFSNSITSDNPDGETVNDSFRLMWMLQGKLYYMIVKLLL